jgi:hypothetical protein
MSIALFIIRFITGVFIVQDEPDGGRFSKTARA